MPEPRRRRDGRGITAHPAVATAMRVAGHRYGAGVIVLVAALAIYGIAEISRPDPARTPAGGTAPVDAGLLACPESGGGRVGVVSAGTGAGESQVGALNGGALGKVGAGGVWSADGVKKGGVVVRSTGGAAVGLAADVTVRGKNGIGGMRCGAPATEHWFMTPGAGDGKIDLYLTNIDDREASVDVIAVSDTGSLDTPDGRALQVEPHSTRIVSMGRSADGLGLLAADSHMLGIKVSSTSGRVVAGVKADLGDKGFDWAPESVAPATTVVLPGVPGGSGRRTLYVDVPGENDARVKVQAVTASGTFVPEGQDVLDAPAQTVTPLDLEDALVGKPAALILTSDRPIVAGFQSGGDDVSLGAGAEPLTGAATLADAREGSSLLLTATTGPAKVRVTPLTKTGRGEPREFDVQGGRTLEIPQDSDGLIVEPVSGTVYGARVITIKGGKKGKERFVTVQPLTPTPLAYRLPPVADSLTAIVR
ncbi:hypothetical protein GCM10010468_76860 [Actinocorallia longicatena]|uniref:Secreted protein n=1 Tax=Actinocorallia longicatena TaxID=111803 RepID=A0ABP6QMV6_9ACTN